MSPRTYPYSNRGTVNFASYFSPRSYVRWLEGVFSPLSDGLLTSGRPLRDSNLSYIHSNTTYRVTRRVFSEPVTSKLHLLNTKNLAGHLKTPKVIRISAMHANFSHSPVHSGPICFNRTKNLKLPSGTNKSK